MSRLLAYGNSYEFNVEQIPDDADIRLYRQDTSFVLDFLDTVEEDYIKNYNELPDDWFSNIKVIEVRTREELENSVSDRCVVHTNGYL